MRLLGAVLCASAMLTGSGADALRAQTVRGVVRDQATGGPIADASVVLLDDRERVVRGALTEPDGSYLLTAARPGRYTVRVGGAGMPTWDSQALRLDRDQVRELNVMMRRAGSMPLAVFERRRQGLEGIFLTAQDIADRGGGRFTDLFRNLEGVVVVPLPARRGERGRFERGSREGFYTIRLFGSRFDAAAVGARQRGERSDDCPPVLFVDGEWWGSLDEAGDRGPDLELLPDELVGIEVYIPAVVPDELNRGLEAERCGVVAVWRRPPP